MNGNSINSRLDRLEQRVGGAAAGCPHCGHGYGVQVGDAPATCNRCRRPVTAERMTIVVVEYVDQPLQMEER